MRELLQRLDQQPAWPLVEQTMDGQWPATLVHSDELRDLARTLVAELRSLGVGAGRPVGLIASNSVAWLAADLALLHEGCTEIPVPLEFTAEQTAHLLDPATVWVMDRPGADRIRQWGLTVDGRSIVHVPEERAQDLPDWSPHVWAPGELAKVIHTSGTTSNPKGVKIRGEGLESLLGALHGATEDMAFGRYLSIAPLSLLIEQVMALYVPLLKGGTVVLPPAGWSLLGERGASLDATLSLVLRAQPSVLMLPPSLVAHLDRAVRIDPGIVGRLKVDGRLPMVLTGGGPVDPEALARLQARGLVVLEGYGLSENGSVVSWNRPGAARLGTAGQPLAHCEVRIAPDGEILVRSSSLFSGYQGVDPTSRLLDEEGWLHTGDKGELDVDGYLSVTGRLKNVIITGEGRNVSPEWVEARLRSLPGVRDASLHEVYGHVVAAVLPDHTGLPGLRATVLAACEARFSDIECPDDVLLLEAEAAVSLYTVTGRPRRTAIRDHLLSIVTDPPPRNERPS